MQRKIHGQIALYKQLFRDNRDFFRIVRVTKVEVATDGSGTMLQCETVTDGLECFVSLSWDPALQSPVNEMDLWLVAFINGDLNNGIAIHRLYNMKDKQHPKGVMEDWTILSSREKKKVGVSNDHMATMTESAVLGPSLVVWLLKLTEQIKSIADDLESVKNTYNRHNHNYIDTIGGPSVPVPTPKVTTANTGVSAVTTAPEKQAIVNLERKTETDKFLSDLLFIQEKGLTNSPPAETPGI